MELKYFVTGAAGFIGANYVRNLMRKDPNAKVLAFDLLTYAGNAATLDAELSTGRLELVRGDVADAAAVESAMRAFKPDFIVHFAAESHVDRSIDNPEPFIRTNVCGTQILLETARRIRGEEIAAGKKPSLKKFIQIGTDEVYGFLPLDRPEGVRLPVGFNRLIGRPDDYPTVTYGTGVFSESTPLDPSSPYSASKASADMIALAYARTYGMPVCVTRCSNNYGPCQFPEKLIPLMINNMLQGRPLPVYGSGMNVRDWLHVDDHCSAIDTVIEKGLPGEVYNIGGFNERLNIDIVKTLIATVSRLLAENCRYAALSVLRPEDINESMIEFVGDRPAHDLRYAIDPGKLVNELGWRPEINFEAGIESTVRWYLDNRDWVESVVSGDYKDYYEKMYSNR